MAQQFAAEFYGSQEWKDCREAYTKYRRGLCEICLSKGIYQAGEIVHHKKHLTPKNIDDPNITLSFDNLLLVCRKCHGDQHTNRKQKGMRYEFDSNGKCIVYNGSEN